MKTIAIIDDDVPIGDMLEELLTKEGFVVIRAYSGTEALYLLERQRPDLVLLDLMLPGLSGEELLPHIIGIPVIVISAKIDIRDKVSVLFSGASDYITKPFDTRELLARIAVQLRKGTNPSALLSAADVTLDPLSHAVTAAETPVKLTRTEYAILKLLLQNPGQAVAKSVILDRISIDTPDCTESSLKVHVSNLRKKLKEAGGRDYIEAIWGIGFAFAVKS